MVIAHFNLFETAIILPPQEHILKNLFRRRQALFRLTIVQ